jgi:hypothetical protein
MNLPYIIAESRGTNILLPSSLRHSGNIFVTWQNLSQNISEFFFNIVVYFLQVVWFFRINKKSIVGTYCFFENYGPWDSVCTDCKLDSVLNAMRRNFQLCGGFWNTDMCNFDSLQKNTFQIKISVGYWFFKQPAILAFCFSVWY